MGQSVKNKSIIVWYIGYTLAMLLTGFATIWAIVEKQPIHALIGLCTIGALLLLIGNVVALKKKSEALSYVRGQFDKLLNNNGKEITARLTAEGKIVTMEQEVVRLHEINSMLEAKLRVYELGADPVVEITPEAVADMMEKSVADVDVPTSPLGKDNIINSILSPKSRLRDRSPAAPAPSKTLRSHDVLVSNPLHWGQRQQQGEDSALAAMATGMAIGTVMNGATGEIVPAYERGGRPEFVHADEPAYRDTGVSCEPSDSYGGDSSDNGTSDY